MTIGEKIRAYRELRGINQIQLAHNSGINVGTIRKYEIGIRNPKPDQLKKIADGLGISVNILLDFDIETCGDVMALLFKLDEMIDISIEGKLGEDGKYESDSISLKLNHPTLKRAIKNWADMNKAIKKIEDAACKESNPENKKIALQGSQEIYNKFKLQAMDSDIIVTKDTSNISVKIREI